MVVPLYSDNFLVHFISFFRGGGQIFNFNILGDFQINEYFWGM